MGEPHAQSAELGYLGLSDGLERLEHGSLRSSQWCEALVERVQALDALGTPCELRAVAAVATDAVDVATERDEERRSGHLRGPLHGVPVMVKDNIEVEGLPGCAGSTALKGRPSRDAALVRRLRDAGAIILGSTNLSEWANIRSPRSSSGWSATGGLVGNPWALDRSAGGSSSGSGAALAAGFTPIAVGSETDGSIICPASVNGVVGLKPTVGTVSTEFVVPISSSQDSPGPMGRSVNDVAKLFAVLSGTNEPAVGGPLRFRFAENWMTGHDPTDSLVVAVIEQLRTHGIEVLSGEVAVPDEQVGADEGTVLFSELLDELNAYLGARPGDGPRTLAEVIEYENEHANIEMPYFSHEHFLTALASGGKNTDTYREARARNLDWATNTCLRPALDGVDVLVSANYVPAWKSDLVLGGHHRLSSPASTPAAIAGWPIMSVPIGLVHGLPVSVALTARANDEWRLIEAARLVESVVAPTRGEWRPSWRSPVRG